MTLSTPSSDIRFVNIYGLPFLILSESLAITSRLAPTSGARSVLFITSKSERVTPGPPFLGIF